MKLAVKVSLHHKKNFSLWSDIFSLIFKNIPRISELNKVTVTPNTLWKVRAQIVQEEQPDYVNYRNIFYFHRSFEESIDISWILRYILVIASRFIIIR